MAQILVVEDEESLLQTLRYNLSRAGHEVRLSTNGMQALEMIRGNPPELVVLDLMLPGLDGLELCRSVRADTANPAVAHVPILMLTARDEEIDKVVGLEVGADDYLTKPFSMHELMARVKAQLRRADMGGAVKDEPLQLASGDLLIDVASRAPRHRAIAAQTP
jgi:two-component system, OmpR family, alkaline phosphatase synthesis response regulator PhoP